MKEKIKPPLVLTLICLCSCALLVAAYNLTYKDTTGIITDKLQKSCEEVLGSGEYEMLLTQNQDGEKIPVTYDGISSVIINKTAGTCAFEIIADGYAKGGLHLLIGLDKDGAISGISIISIGETPGLGTKVQNPDFLNSFIGMKTSDAKADSITGATYSSNGMKKAAAIAVSTFAERKGEIFSE